MKQKRLAPTFFLTGFVLGCVSSFSYLMWGGWGRIPLFNMSVPSSQWARVVFWPGLGAGRKIFSHLFPHHMAADNAKYIACFGGMLVTGIVFGVVLLVVAELLLRKSGKSGRHSR